MPTAALPIPDSDAYVLHQVTSSSTGPFAVPFPLPRQYAGALHVAVDGVELAPSAFAFQPDDATVAGFPSGVVVLVQSVENADVEIWRDTPITRVADYPSGPLDFDAFNAELSRLTMQVQDARLRAKRSELWTGGVADLAVPATMTAIVQAASREYAAALLSSALRMFYLEAYGAIGDGVTNDRPAFVAAYAAAAAAGGGIIKGARGKTYKITAGVPIAHSDVVVDLDGATLKPVGSSFAALSWSGSLGANLTLAENASRFARSLVVNSDSAALLAVGDWLFLQQGVTGWTFATQITGKSGTTISFADTLPFAFQTSAVLTFAKWTPVRRGGLRNAVIDVSEATDVSGFAHYYATQMLHENIEVVGALSATGGAESGKAFLSWVGRRNLVRNVRMRRCGGGSANDSDFQPSAETESTFENICSEHSYDFGPIFHLLTRCHIRGLSSYAATARGLKLQQTIFTTLDGFVVSGCGATALGVVQYASDNLVSNGLIDSPDIGGVGTGIGLGLWLDNTANERNKFVNIGIANCPDHCVRVQAPSDYNLFENVTVDDLAKVTVDTTTLRNHLRVNGRAQAFRAHKNGTNQTSVAAGSYQAVTMGTEAFDYFNRYSTADSQWVPPAGPVRIAGRVGVTGVDSGEIVTVGIRKDGNLLAAGVSVTVNGGAARVSVECEDVADGQNVYTLVVFAGGSTPYTVDGTIAHTSFQGEVC